MGMDVSRLTPFFLDLFDATLSLFPFCFFPPPPSFRSLKASVTSHLFFSPSRTPSPPFPSRPSLLVPSLSLSFPSFLSYGLTQHTHSH